MRKEKYKIPTTKISCRVETSKIEALMYIYGLTSVTELVDALIEEKVSDTFKVEELKSPLIWFGGKYFLFKHLLPWIPEHRGYVEPFGGGCNPFMIKPPSKVEIYNDINGQVTNFLLQVRLDPYKFYKAAATLPFSRELFEQSKKEAWPADDFERAVIWFYRVRSGFSGEIDKGWKHTVTRNVAASYQEACRLVVSMQKRFLNVQIERTDFRNIFRIYDGPDVFFFVDPPYRGREHKYDGDFTDNDHEELAYILKYIDGKAMVTYYPDELIDELYKDKGIWRRKEIVTTKHSALVERNGKRPKGLEYIYMNYDSQDLKYKKEAI